jgi:hypothetical protein
LSDLNGRYLQLQPVDPKQLARLQDIPARVAAPSGPDVAALDSLPPAVADTAVSRSTPRPARPLSPEAPRPTVASSIFTTLIGFVGEDEGRAGQ